MEGNITLCDLYAPDVPYIIIYIWGDVVLVHRVRLGSSLDKKLDKKLRKLAEKTKIPISKLLDEAVEDLIIKRTSK